MYRVLVVIGTRPEAIKMAPVVKALRACGSDVEVRIALTGQHTTLVDQVLQAFALDPEYDVGVPDYDLAIMKAGQSLYDVVGGTLDGLRGVLGDFRPHVLLVQGDTATVFAASLAAFFEQVRIGHVEAGLRSGDKWAPFPEEVLRRLTDVLADYWFAPTPQARANLEREGVAQDRVYVTGNTVVDAVLLAADRPHEIENEALRQVLADSGSRLVLLTAHRRESFGAPLRSVFGAVREIADRLEDVRVLYPVHPNPSVLEPAKQMLSDHPRVHLTDPLGYLDVVTAMKHASLVLTDSGGIQEEAPTFGSPVLVLREVSERPEGLEAGVAELVGTNHARIVQASLRALSSQRPAAGANPYGDGKAAERIADIVMADLEGRGRRIEDWSG